MNPEAQDGNIEYKRKLIIGDKHKINKIASQMRYRMEEGKSECIYILGVADDGELLGVTELEYEETIKNLSSAASQNKYNVSILTTTKLPNEKFIYEVLIREINEHKYINIKIGIAGSVDSGKSSFLGVISKGENDNGRGSARLSVFNYPHEIKTGRTSSIAHHIVGFNIDGNIVNYNIIGKSSWPEIVKDSYKVITFLDLAGHEKYLKTTIMGLGSHNPDLCFIIIGANRGVLQMTKEHIFLCITLKIPFAIIITKIDMVKNAKNVLKETTDSISHILKATGVRRVPLKVETKDDIVLCAKNIFTENITPVFHISNVTGEGIDNVKSFLNLVSKRESYKETDDVEYHIDSIFNVAGVGKVVGGSLVSGTIKIGDKLLMGPINNSYQQVTIKSIHCKRVSLQNISYGSYVCLGIRGNVNIRKGSVLISPKSEQIICHEFKAVVNVLRTHSTTMRIGYEPVLYSSSVRQTVRLISILNKNCARNPEKTIQDDILRTGDRAEVIFKFKYTSEYIKPGDKIILCEGNTKVVGVLI